MRRRGGGVGYSGVFVDSSLSSSSFAQKIVVGFAPLLGGSCLLVVWSTVMAAVADA